MIVKLLNNLSKIGKSNRQAAPLPTPDISRVLRSAPPAPETEKGSALLLTQHASLLSANAEEAIASLATEFEGWMRNDLSQLCAAWEKARQPDSDAEAYRAVYICAHNIRGAATSYGYPAASRLCGSLCSLLSASQPGENGALINLHIEACRAAVAAGPEGEGSASIADAVCEALERRVAQKLRPAV